VAEPIAEVVDRPDDDALRREIQALWATPGQREAVERTLDLLRALNERGLLDGARAILEGNEASGRAIREFLMRSQDLRIARNLRAAFELLAAIDLGGGGRGAGRSPGAPARPMGLLELRRRLRDPDVSAGLEVVLGALAAIGRARRG